MKVKLGTALQVLLPLAFEGSTPIGWPIEEAMGKLIPEVRNVLKAFKPEFK